MAPGLSYFFEQYLADQNQAALPWWDWSTQTGLPAAYAEPNLPDGSTNPLASGPITGIPEGQFTRLPSR